MPHASEPRPRRSLRRPAPVLRTAPLAGLLLGLLVPAGCQTSSSPANGGAQPVGRAEPWTETIIPDTIVDARPAAFVNGRSVPWGRIRDELTEAAGGEILRDLVLQEQLARALEDAQVRLRPADIDAEQAVLLDTLDPDRDVSARLLAELRDRRRLGDARFRGLLRRNAALRALVADQVRITDVDRQVTRDMLYGAQRRVRIMTLPRVADAERAYVQVSSPGGPSFAELAAEVSTDVSASRGGLLEPMSRLDPTWPAGVREAAFDLELVDAVSSPILLEGSIALLQLVEIIPERTNEAAAARDRIDRIARLSRERVLMDRLARELVNGAAVSIIDPVLRDAWDRERRRARRD